MSIWLIVLAAWVVGSSVVLVPSFSVLTFVEVSSSIILLALNITNGSSVFFTTVSIVVFVLFSSICYFTTALCAAMIAFGRISDSRRSGEDAQSAMSAVDESLSDNAPAADTMVVVKVQRNGTQHGNGNDDPVGAENFNASEQLRQVV
jgi:hypothetical protein